MKLRNTLFSDVPINKDEDLILFFAPDSLIVPHFAGQCVLAKTLESLGYRTLFVRCGGDYSRCPVIDMERLPYDLDEQTKLRDLCSKCTAVHDAVMREYGLKSIHLHEYLTNDLREKAAQIAHGALESPTELEYDSVKIGKLSGIDFTLITKHGDMSTLSAEQKQIWTLYNENCLRTYLAVDRMCEALPVKRICVFNIYSALIGAGLVAKRRGIPFINTTMPAHMSIDYRRYIVLPQAFTNEIKKTMIRDWYRWRDIPIERSNAFETSLDTLTRQAGKKAQHYSPGRQLDQEDLYKRLNLDRDKKLLVAYPSSNDEQTSIQLVGEAFDQPFVLEGNPFDTQLDWLLALVNYVEDSDDLQLIVRLHPRESANKRESAVSLQLSILKEALGGTYKHCRIIWPEESISSYDLAEIADIGLTSWSSMGLEFARLGIPSLSCVRFVTFVDDDFLRWGGETEQEYFSELRATLEMRPCRERLLRAFRAYHYSLMSHSVLLDDVVPDSNFRQLPPFKMPREAKAIEDVFVNGSRLVAYNRKRLKALDCDQMREAEKAEVEDHIRRTIHFYFTGEIDERPRELLKLQVEPGAEEFAVQEHSEHLGSRTAVLLTSRSSTVHYFCNGRMYRRESPLLRRLARLVSESNKDNQYDQHSTTVDRLVLQ